MFTIYKLCLFSFVVRNMRDGKDKNYHHSVSNPVPMSTPEKAFKQAQDLLYAMAAKTPVSNRIFELTLSFFALTVNNNRYIAYLLQEKHSNKPKSLLPWQPKPH